MDAKSMLNFNIINTESRSLPNTTVSNKDNISSNKNKNDSKFNDAIKDEIAKFEDKIKNENNKANDGSKPNKDKVDNNKQEKPNKQDKSNKDSLKDKNLLVFNESVTNEQMIYNILFPNIQLESVDENLLGDFSLLNNISSTNTDIDVNTNMNVDINTNTNMNLATDVLNTNINLDNTNLEGNMTTFDSNGIKFNSDNEVLLENNVVKQNVVKDNDVVLESLNSNNNQELKLDNAETLIKDVNVKNISEQGDDVSLENIVKSNIVRSDNVDVDSLDKKVKPELLDNKHLFLKQRVFDGELVNVKVGDTINLDSKNIDEQIVNKILMSKTNEFEIQLSPEDLGKLQIKLVFDGNETKVSILCDNLKAFKVLTENSGGLMNLLENRTGSTATIEVYDSKESFYKENYNDGHNSQNNNEQQEQKKQHKAKGDMSSDFLQQMRIGLV